jgi:hypothetical protein
MEAIKISSLLKKGKTKKFLKKRAPKGVAASRDVFMS